MTKNFEKIEEYWKMIITFGKFTSTYKYNLAKSILELSKDGRKYINLEELSIPYYRNMCEHLLKEPIQIRGKDGAFIKACLDFNDLKISEKELQKVTIEKGFIYVLDTFHNVEVEYSNIEFFTYDKKNKQIILTKDFEILIGTVGIDRLLEEVEDRWREVEEILFVGN